MKKIFYFLFVAITGIIIVIMYNWSFTKSSSPSIPWDLKKGDTVTHRNLNKDFFLPKTIRMSGNNWSESYEYDRNGKLLSFIRIKQLPKETYSTRNTYDGKGNLIISKNDLSNDFGVVSSTVDSFVYNSRGDTATSIFEEYQFGYKKNSLKSTFNYNAKSKLISKNTEIQYWNSWVNSSRQNFLYDSKDKVSSIIGEVWEYNNWVKNSQILLQYDNEGNISLYKYEHFKAGMQDSGMVKATTYNKNRNILTQETELWVGDKWEKLEKVTFKYDESGKLINKLSEEWVERSWIKAASFTGIYDRLGRIHEELVEIWSKGVLTSSITTKFEIDETSGSVRQISEINKDGNRIKLNWMTLKYDKNHNFFEIVTDPAYRSAKNIIAYFNKGTEYVNISSSAFDIIEKLEINYHQISN